MNQIKSIFKNSSWLSISQVITNGLAFLWTIIIARYLGVNDYGVISFAISFNFLLSIFMELGIHTYMIREVAKNKDLSNKFVNNIFLFKIILAILLFLLTMLVLYFLNYPTLTIIVTLIFTIELTFLSLVNFLNSLFQAFEEVKYQSIGTILNSVLLFIGILLTIFFNLGVISIACSYTLAYSIFFIFMFFMYIRKFGFPKFELDLSFLKEVIIKSIPFGLTSFFYTIYFSIDIVMLSYLTGDYATGIYKSAYNIITVFTTFFGIYGMVIFPVMSKFFKESKNLIKISYELSIKYLLLIILPVSIGIFLYSEPILDLIYSNQYSLASVPLQILIWAVCFLVINVASSTLLNAINMEFVVTKIYIIAAIFNVILNILLIPRFSYNGAAISTVLSEILITILTIYYISKTDYHPDTKLLKVVIKLVISAIILISIMYYINATLFVAIPITCITYILLLVIMNIFDENDKYIIRQLLNK